jgi:predicted deacylase
MAHLRMIDAPAGEVPATRFCAGSRWIRSPRSGYFVSTAALGQEVRKGDVVGAVHVRKEEFSGSASEEEVRAPGSGVVIGRRENPLVHEGDAIVHVAK